jgi:aminoglycoside phosphotransferase (APT) family kinase protein
VGDSGGRVLVFETDRGRALPRVDVEGHAGDDLERTRRALGELVGTRVAILRRVARELDEERRLSDVVYELEPLDGDFEPPPGATWRGADAVPDEHRELVERHLEERREGVPALRAPWAREGWLAEASEWIEASLAAHGRASSGPVEQVRSWSLSSVLRVPTTEGAVFFKATAALPLFVVEGRVMQGLARLHPKNVPEPVAVDMSRRWLLLDDVGPALGWSAPVEQRMAALSVFGHLQVASAKQVDALLAMGCVDRRPEWLARETRKLLADENAIAGLEADELARLRALEPRLVALCQHIARGPVPSTVVHGDLHLGNVAERDGSLVFFDWSDAGVAHPFLDLIDVTREEDSALRARLRDAYLAVWAGDGSSEELLELWAMAAPLASLNQAVSYRYICANVEAGSTRELEWALPYWLRKVLETDFDALPG